VPEERSRLPFAALGFAAAAAFSSWNPISAPFGLVVGVAALLLAVRALRRSGPGRRRAVSAGALVLSAGAVVASGLVLALTAGVGRELGGTPVVPVPPRADFAEELDSAAERTRAARERARSELEALDRSDEERGGGQGRPAGAGAGEPARR
jgi:hypothetical protein